MTRILLIDAVGEAGGDVRREGAGADDGVQQPVVFDDLAAQRLGEAVGRLGDLLEQEVRGVAAVDVAGRHLGRRSRRPPSPAAACRRSRDASMPSSVPAAAASSADDLAAVLAVEADVARRLLDDAVGLAGDDVAVVGEADVHALPAAVEGEEDAPGIVGGGERRSPPSPRTTATVRRKASNSAGRRGAASDERRDHLGVGGDRTGDAQGVLDAQVGVVVDVAVEHADDERRFGRRRPAAPSRRCSRDGRWARR